MNHKYLPIWCFKTRDAFVNHVVVFALQTTESTTVLAQKGVISGAHLPHSAFLLALILASPCWVYVHQATTVDRVMTALAMPTFIPIPQFLASPWPLAISIGVGTHRELKSHLPRCSSGPRPRVVRCTYRAGRPPPRSRLMYSPCPFSPSRPPYPPSPRQVHRHPHR